MWSTRRELSQQCDVTASLSCREGPGPVWVLWYYAAVLVGSIFCRLAQFRIHVAAASLRAFIFCPLVRATCRIVNRSFGVSG